MNLAEHFLFGFGVVWACIELTKIRIALEALKDD
jgi:hypothetical protein